MSKRVILHGVRDWEAEQVRYAHEHLETIFFGSVGQVDSWRWTDITIEDEPEREERVERAIEWAHKWVNEYVARMTKPEQDDSKD